MGIIAMITDFGIVKRMFGEDSSKEFGNWPYVSPERFTNPENVKESADIYSFGILLYELLTGGTRPYPYEKEILKASYPKHRRDLYERMHCKEEIRPIIQIRKDCPTQLANLVHKCLL